MAGIIVELIISWILLWVFFRQGIFSVLGLKPTGRRVGQLFIGLLMAASCCTIYQVMTTAFANNSWTFNTRVSALQIFEGTRFAFVSVIFEELLFRGALLFIAIRKWGISRACLVSAVCFGVYHWFTFNAFGNPFLMVVTFLMTGIVGLSWAYSFAKTKALYLPIGLHLGWNLFIMVVFSNGNFGEAIFIRSNSHQVSGILMVVAFLFQVIALPLLTFWYLGWLERRNAPGPGGNRQPLPQGISIRDEERWKQGRQ